MVVVLALPPILVALGEAIVFVGSAAVAAAAAVGIGNAVSEMSNADEEAGTKPATGAIDEVCSTCPPSENEADAPGQPKEEDGYTAPKKWDGKKVRSPNGRGYGWPDKNGNVWVPTGPGSSAHGGPHWDVQRPGGGYINVYPGGKTRGGR